MTDASTVNTGGGPPANKPELDFTSLLKPKLAAPEVDAFTEPQFREFFGEFRDVPSLLNAANPSVRLERTEQIFKTEYQSIDGVVKRCVLVPRPVDEDELEVDEL